MSPLSAHWPGPCGSLRGGVLRSPGIYWMIPSREASTVWPADQPHIPIETIRDWFASYIYMPRARDEATLDGALQRLVEDFAEPYVFASAFNEEDGSYDGVIEGTVRVSDRLRSGLLVRRDAVPTRETEDTEGDETGETVPTEGGGERAETRPGRFFASIPVSPNRQDSRSPASWTRASSSLPAGRARTSA